MKIKTENTVTDKRHKLRCPYMKLTNSYDIIPLESVVRNVHVVPDFLIIIIDILLIIMLKYFKE
jgi:hypothetical protein